MPAVVFNVQVQTIDLALLKDTSARFEAHDNVFNTHFTIGSVLLVQNISPYVPAELSQECREYLVKRSSRLHVLEEGDGVVRLPEGPYILKARNLHQAWRLYPDESRCLVTTIVPDDGGDRYK